MRRTAGVKVLLFALALLCGARAASAQGAAPAESKDERLARILERVGERVESYQQGLFSIAFTEVLRREELRKDMTAKKSKEFVFDTVVLREAVPGGEDDDYYPKSVRRLKSAGGKPPKRGERVPTEFAVASLNFLLPKNRTPSESSLDGEETIGGRACFRVRMLRRGQGPPRVEWKRGWRGGRFWVSAPMVLLIWIDAETFDVLRLESHLAAPFEFDGPRAFGSFGPSRHFKYAVQDYSVSFRRRQFKGPEQTLLVPESAEMLRVIEGASRPRLRSTLRLSDYRRFRSDVNVVEEPEGQGSRR
jgi:hypothetical protein